MKHLADILFLIGLLLSSFGIYNEFSPYIAAIFSGLVLLFVGFFAAFKVKK